MARAAIARAIGAPAPDAPIASTSAAGAATADKPNAPVHLVFGLEPL